MGGAPNARKASTREAQAGRSGCRPSGQAGGSRRIGARGRGQKRSSEKMRLEAGESGQGRSSEDTGVGGTGHAWGTWQGRECGRRAYGEEAGTGGSQARAGLCCGPRLPPARPPTTKRRRLPGPGLCPAVGAENRGALAGHSRRGGTRTVKASAPRGAPVPLEGSPPGPSAALAAGPGARPGGSHWGPPLLSCPDRCQDPGSGALAPPSRQARILGTFSPKHPRAAGGASVLLSK